MDVRPLLASTINWERLIPELDEVGDQVRLATVRELGQVELARLFDSAATHAPLALDALTTNETPTLPIIHEGHQPGALFPRFSMQMARREDGTQGEEVVGYQERARFDLSGSAYFTAIATDDGSVSFDYGRVPKDPPLGWPPPAPPGKAYRERSDVLRRVSAHVTVGRQMRGGKPVDLWFALVRKTGRF